MRRNGTFTLSPITWILIFRVRFRRDLDQLLACKYLDLAANQYDLESYDEAIQFGVQELTISWYREGDDAEG